MEMNKFFEACDNFLKYPQNIIQHEALEHSLRAFFNRLNDQASRLFVDGDSAALDFLDLEDGQREMSTAFQPVRIQSLGDLKEQLREALRERNSEPICRFIFIHARHSRDPLSISYEMFCFLFSYLQVLPTFLDFVFPFGDQEHAQDFYFTGFREEVLLENSYRGLCLRQLGRSGREMRLCFNLRSVEVSRREVETPWSIRQTAIYHTFDFETGKSVWITVKGNTVIKKRVSDLAKSLGSSIFDSVSGAFTATLKTHLLLCDWSVENWRWYINDLENSLRALTRPALSTVVDRPPSPVFHNPMVPPLPMSSPTSPRGTNGPFPGISRNGTFSSLVSPRQKQRTFSGLSSPPVRTMSDMSNARTITNESGQQGCWGPHADKLQHGVKEKVASFLRNLTPLKSWRQASDESSSFSEKPVTPPCVNDPRQEPDVMPPGMSNGEEHHSEEIKFSDLQRIQYIEDKAHEVSLVLQLNIEVLQELRQHYVNVSQHPDLPAAIKADCETEIARFKRCVAGAEKDLRMQHSRTDTLLRLLAERKTFLYGILQYQSMQASEAFAKKAHESAINMEALTNNMNELAQKTKQETVSMRIITLVTLFFLPGTFIGVIICHLLCSAAANKSTKTFMSTDIIKYGPDNQQHFQSNGLKLYLAICIPLMLLTFLAWALVYRSVEKGRKTKNPSAAALNYSDSV